MLFAIMAALVQMELDIKRAPVVESIAKRREAGMDLGGRPQLISDSNIRTARRLIDAGETAATVSRDLGTSQATFFRRTRTLELAGRACRQGVGRSCRIDASRTHPSCARDESVA